MNGQKNEEMHKETVRLTDSNKEEERITPIAMHQWHAERVDTMKCKQVLGELRLMEAAIPDTVCPSYPTSSPTACLTAALTRHWQEVLGELCLKGVTIPDTAYLCFPPRAGPTAAPPVTPRASPTTRAMSPGLELGAELGMVLDMTHHQRNQAFQEAQWQAAW